MTDRTADLDALRVAAERYITAYDRMVERGGGIGGLAVHEPEMYEHMRAWTGRTDYDHADTVLMLLDLLAEARADGARQALLNAAEESRLAPADSEKLARWLRARAERADT